MDASVDPSLTAQLELLEIGVWCWDPTKSRFTWSDAFGFLHGFLPQENGAPLEVLGTKVHEGDRDTFVEAFRALAASSFPMRYRVASHDAAVRRLEIRALEPTPHPASSWWGVCFEVAHDGLDRGGIERRLEVISHDLRNHLNTIQIALDVLRRDLGVGHEGLRRIDVIERAVMQAGILTNRLPQLTDPAKA